MHARHVYLAMLCTILMATGCRLGKSPPRLSLDDVSTLAPVGSTPEDVMREMERAGYKCRLAYGEDCTVQLDSNKRYGSRHVLRDQNFVSCGMTTQDGWVTSIQEFVFILGDDSTVEQIYDCMDFIGP